MGEFTVQRTMTIGAPPESAYPHVADFRRWASWSPWEHLAPGMNKAFSGAEAGVGARYSWSGNHKVGRGSMEITAAEAPARIEVVIDVSRPFRATNTAAIWLEPSARGTDITLSMTGERTRFMRTTGIYRAIEAAIGRDFERGLQRLKAVVEAA